MAPHTPPRRTHRTLRRNIQPRPRHHAQKCHDRTTRLSLRWITRPLTTTPTPNDRPHRTRRICLGRSKSIRHARHHTQARRSTSSMRHGSQRPRPLVHLRRKSRQIHQKKNIPTPKCTTTHTRPQHMNISRQRPTPNNTTQTKNQTISKPHQHEP